MLIKYCYCCKINPMQIYRKEENIMAQLWGGRFTKETDQLVYNFNASILIKSSTSRISEAVLPTPPCLQPVEYLQMRKEIR